jgi:hypothetical protein
LLTTRHTAGGDKLKFVLLEKQTLYCH